MRTSPRRSAVCCGEMKKPASITGTPAAEGSRPRGARPMDKRVTVQLGTAGWERTHALTYHSASRLPAHGRTPAGATTSGCRGYVLRSGLCRPAQVPADPCERLCHDLQVQSSNPLTEPDDVPSHSNEQNVVVSGFSHSYLSSPENVVSQPFRVQLSCARRRSFART